MPGHTPPPPVLRPRPPGVGFVLQTRWGLCRDDWEEEDVGVGLAEAALEDPRAAKAAWVDQTAVSQGGHGGGRSR